MAIAEVITREQLIALLKDARLPCLLLADYDAWLVSPFFTSRLCRPSEVAYPRLPHTSTFVEPPVIDYNRLAFGAAPSGVFIPEAIVVFGTMGVQDAAKVSDDPITFWVGERADLYIGRYRAQLEP